MRSFRRRWKPLKERLQKCDPEHPTNIRFHRARSWRHQAEHSDEQGDRDMALIGRWIAFNALYGQWDGTRQEPLGAAACWRAFLDGLLEWIYLLRCQLVHGAATCHSTLSRTATRHCSTMLARLLPAILLVWIDHGADEDWGPMCYPPQR